MTDVDRLGIGICFIIGFGGAAQGKGCFLCPTNGI